MVDSADSYFSANFRLRLGQFNLDVDFRSGPEMVVIFGPSGAGKSLLLQTIAGLKTPDEGRIIVGDRILFDSDEDIEVPPQARRVGYVPQQYALFPHISIAKNISYGLNNLSPQERKDRTDRLLELMRLSSFADRKPDDVSGGQQQRVALARALAIQPNILLMDEPFSALDEPLRAHMRDELLSVQQTFGIPVFLVTHSLEEAYTLADRVVVLVDGEIVQNDQRDTVFRKPNSPEIALMMGMTNLFDVTVLEDSDGAVQADWNGIEISFHSTGRFNAGDTITLGIRPEDVMIVRRKATPSEERPETLLQGVLISDKAMGYDHVLTFEVDSRAGRQTNHIFVRIPHPTFLRIGLEVGETRSLSMKPTSFQVFQA